MRDKVAFPSDLLARERSRTVELEAGCRTLKPTLLLGLGRTGVEVLSILRGKISTYYEELGEFRELIQFLLMDVGDPEPHVMSQIGQNDFVSLKTENIQLTVNSLRHSDDSFKRWWDNQYTAPKKDITESTGGFRQLGRLALRSNLSKIRHALLSKIERCLGTEKGYSDSRRNEPVEALNVFVLLSSCGGTGGGILLDMLFMLYKLIEIEKRISLNVYVFLLLPSAYIDKLYISFKQFRLLHANTYALFREINYLTSEKSKHARSFWKSFIEPISRTEGKNYEGFLPFKHCFIIDNRVQDSRLIPLEQLFSIIARVLFSLVTSPVKMTDKGGADIGLPASFYHDELFSTLGFSRMYSLTSSVIEYLCGKCAIDLARNTFLIGNVWSDMRALGEKYQTLLEETQNQLEDEIEQSGALKGFGKELFREREKAMAMIPRFIPFPNVSKIVQFASESRERIIRKIEECLQNLEEKMKKTIGNAQMRLSHIIIEDLESEIETKGVSYCREVVYKLKAIFSDYAGRVLSGREILAKKEECFKNLLTEKIESIAQKKEIHKNLEELYEILREYGEYRFRVNIGFIKEEYARGLSKNRTFLEMEQRIQKGEKNLREILNDMQFALDDLGAFREQDLITSFFPGESFHKSESLEMLYRIYYNKDTQDELGTRFIRFSKDYFELKKIFENLDYESRNKLVSALYRFAFHLFSGSLRSSAVWNIPLFLKGKQDEFRALIAASIDEIEPVLLIDADELRQTLLWSCREEDSVLLTDLCPYELQREKFLLALDSNEIFFFKIFAGFSIDEMETTRLSLDHYIHLIKKNEDALKKQGPLPFPIHIERDWHREFRLLPSLFA